jgi:23S rRNA (cytosine1962-C5)-methyltransferase
MFISDKWKDYELLEVAEGEKLERWGNFYLVRPDPQDIWKGQKSSKLWTKADAIYRRSNEGGGKWVKKNVPDEWQISYGDLKFSISPMGFKHTGIFPEQAANWDWFSELIKKANRQINVLNLFAYTGAASVAAAKAGAKVCHVDASKGMVQKAKLNASLSDVPSDSIRYIVDDCFKFVQREIRRGNKYDAIILDPPSYGRGPGGEKWMIEKDLDGLIASISLLLSDKPLFLLLNSYTTGLSPSSCGYILHTNICKKYGGTIDNQELGIPVSADGICLPCGASSRWTP